MSASPATDLPPKAVLADALAMLQQHDYEMNAYTGQDPLQDQRIKASVLAVEARIERLEKGTPKKDDARLLKKWLKGQFDGGAGEDSGWDAAEAWAYDRSPKVA